MALFFEKTKSLNDSADGILCRIHLLKSQFSTGEMPPVLRQSEYQKVRSKLEKNFPVESADFSKVLFRTLYHSILHLILLICITSALPPFLILTIHEDVRKCSII